MVFPFARRTGAAAPVGVTSQGSPSHWSKGSERKHGRCGSQHDDVKIFLDPRTGLLPPGSAARPHTGRSPTNRWAIATLSDGCGRPMDNREIIGASASAVKTFGKAASRAASSQGATPSRVNANDAERHSILFIADRGEGKVVQISPEPRRPSPR
jgi:hypothetical protein